MSTSKAIDFNTRLFRDPYFQYVAIFCYLPSNELNWMETMYLMKAVQNLRFTKPVKSGQKWFSHCDRLLQTPLRLMHELSERFLAQHSFPALQRPHNKHLVRLCGRSNHHPYHPVVLENHLRIPAVNQLSWRQVPVIPQVVPFADIVLDDVEQVHARVSHQIGEVEGALKAE